MLRALTGVVAVSGACFILLCSHSIPGVTAQTNDTAAVNSSPPSRVAPRDLLNQYCVACHNERLLTGGLALDRADITHPENSAGLWEKVAAKVRAGEMPPKGMPRPSKATMDEFVTWLEKSLDDAATVKPNPGRVAVHRLNRTEYANAIRDLLSLEFDSRSLIVADDQDQQGFENIAGVLSVSPVLLESYMSAAGKIARLAVGDPSLLPVFETYTISKTLSQDDRMNEDLPFGSRGGIAVRHHFPLDAEYVIKIRLRRQLYDYIVGLGRPQQLEVYLDGDRVKAFSIGGENHGTPAPSTFAGDDLSGSPDWEEYTHSADTKLELRLPAKAGTRTVAVSFVGEAWEPEGIIRGQTSAHGLARDELWLGKAAVGSVAIGGPYAAAGKGDSASRRKLFICRPSTTAEEEPCAERILSTVAHRAYRRPITDADRKTLLEFYRKGRLRGDFEAGLQLGLRRVLVDPDFLFRIEETPAGLPAGSTFRLSNLELASRLSFFLWSTVPDEELLKTAELGKLSVPTVLDKQVRRMLSDDRSSALVTNFASQWLDLGKLRSASPDPQAYPEFNDTLREVFQSETELFLKSQIREDRPVEELLTSNYTYINERLARFYGVPNVYGSHFRKVTFDGHSQRGGLLGQGSLLMLTSHPTRTSPVIRGKWLLENILGMPPPPPPPDVPALKTEGPGGRPTSIRAQMELHRKNPACAGCHSRMDPLGFALENFDAIGKWRTMENGKVLIDASAVWPDGTTFEGVQGLKGLMHTHREQFLRTFTEKLLTYALGREVEYYDMATVRSITRQASADNYRWSAVILDIVESTPFQMGIVTNPTTSKGDWSR